MYHIKFSSSLLFSPIFFLGLPIYGNGSGEVRLVSEDELNNSSGRVEVKVNRTWSMVCEDFWSVADARVVCRQLGFQTNEHSEF